MLAALLLAAATPPAYPGKAPWRDAKDVFVDGEPVPGLPHPQYLLRPLLIHRWMGNFALELYTELTAGAGTATDFRSRHWSSRRSTTYLHSPTNKFAQLRERGVRFVCCSFLLGADRQECCSSEQVLAFAQAYVVERSTMGQVDRLGGTSSDGNDGWIDIVARRGLGSMEHDSSVAGPKPPWQPGPLQLIFRNSSIATKEYHACQQPTPVVDYVKKKILLLSSLDNWHMRLQESIDDGRTFTPSHLARDLDASLRRPGWGLIFTGLPGGIQLQAPNPHAGRLVLCSSAYWSGGEIAPNGKIVKQGDVLSRYSYSIISDDHGSTWRIGSDKIQPRHTTECSVAQSFDGTGDVFIYTRIWAKTCSGCAGYGRGIARSTDGGSTWDNATLRGLPDTAPDCEGSMASSLITRKDPTDGKLYNTTCFYVSSPYSAGRKNLTMQKSCGPSAPDTWDPPVVVDPGSSSYSSVGVRHPSGPGVPKLYDLWAWANGTESPNACMSGGGIVPRKGKGTGPPFCEGGIRYAEVGFPDEHGQPPAAV